MSWIAFDGGEDDLALGLDGLTGSDERGLHRSSIEIIRHDDVCRRKRFAKRILIFLLARDEAQPHRWSVLADIASHGPSETAGCAEYDDAAGYRFAIVAHDGSPVTTSED